MFKWISSGMKKEAYYIGFVIITLFFYTAFTSSISIAQESSGLNNFPVSGGSQVQKEAAETKEAAKPLEVIENKNEQLDTYVIGPEDVLNISVWKNEDLNHQVIVRPDGKVSFPLIGDIQGGGKTPEELRMEITQRLSKFIPDAVVTVMVLKINSIKVYVIGNVPHPGEFILGRSINVLQALSKAGGLSEFADSRDIIIIRTMGKRQIKIPFNYKEITKGNDTAQNIYLQTGDVIVIP